ncbi:nuclear pore complex protein NUP96 [Senna tora]|uniref:Nuclear pore complex protein NUP96 n=1 Tax=Senna tora TaxID=362788 RepID=A0A834XBI4_9FABA|nr:nuclear pore complex protein NUP96 [Senna tora]
MVIYLLVKYYWQNDEGTPEVVYSKMANEICDLLLLGIGDGAARDDRLSCFDTVLTSPIPEDRRSRHVQDAVSVFTCFISELAT